MKLSFIDFGHNDDLPVDVRASMDDDTQTLFRAALNSHLRDGRTEMHAYAKAYRMLSDLGYTNIDGRWSKGEAEEQANDDDVAVMPMFAPPVEVIDAAKVALESGQCVDDITAPLAAGESLAAAEVRKIADSSDGSDAWGGKHAQKWADRVLRKLEKADGDEVSWITVNGSHIPIGGRDATKSELAKKNYNPATKEKQQRADVTEQRLAASLGLQRTPDNSAFDLVKGKCAIEVKTLVDAKVDKITMRRECRLRKLEYAQKNKMRMYTVVADARSGQTKYYFSAGVGSFRLSGMQSVSLDELKRRVY